MSVGHSMRQDIFSAAASWTKPHCWPSHKEAWGWNNSPRERGHGSRGNRELPLTQWLSSLWHNVSSAHCPDRAPQLSLLTVNCWQTDSMTEERWVIRWRNLKGFSFPWGLNLSGFPSAVLRDCISGERCTPWGEWTIQFVFHVVLKMFGLSNRHFEWGVPIIRNKTSSFWTKVSLWWIW